MEMPRFNVGDKIIYKPFIDGYDLNAKAIIYERECFGKINKVNIDFCLGRYNTYDIILDDEFALKGIHGYELGTVKDKMIYFYAMNRYGDVEFVDKCNSLNEFYVLKKKYWDSRTRLVLSMITESEYNKIIDVINDKTQNSQESIGKILKLEYEDGE